MFSQHLAGALSGVPRPKLPVDAFARPLAPAAHFDIAESAIAVAEQLPVLQLMPLPQTLKPGTYANPASNVNPSGSYASLAAFQQLTDPIPQFARYYSPTPTSTESLYGNLINSANATPGSSFTAQVIASAQRTFQQSALANMGGIIGNWHPVYASPNDWYDVSNVARFQPITMDLSGGAPAIAGFATLPGADDSDHLVWNIGSPGHAEATALDPKTTIQRITFDALRVDLSRPWLQFELFQSRGWQLSGQPAGSLSSGEMDRNAGMMPLIATGLIVSCNLKITAQWAPADEQILRNAIAGLPVALGPFALSAGTGVGLPRIPMAGTVESNLVQVMAWISELVPFSPPAAG